MGKKYCKSQGILLVQKMGHIRQQFFSLRQLMGKFVSCHRKIGGLQEY